MGFVDVARIKASSAHTLQLLKKFHDMQEYLEIIVEKIVKMPDIEIILHRAVKNKYYEGFPPSMC